MTFIACNLNVPACQRKLCLRVAFARKNGDLKSRLGMALIAPVVMGLGSEFPAVRFYMAIRAEPLTGFVPPFAAAKLMTFYAWQR
jgi:hypothetical protein